MGTLTTDGKNVATDAVATASTHAALFDELGVELTGGTPAYARKAITWDPAVAGVAALATFPEFDVPAGKTVATVKYMSALVAGTAYGTDAVTSEVFAGQGTYTLSSGSITASDPA